jgi:methylmalonyl-CoA mutase cobalamin-binding subunit
LIEDHDRMAALIRRAFANTGIEVEVYNSVATARAAISRI